MSRIWKEIPGRPGYFASTDGFIRGAMGGILKPYPNGNGYWKVKVGTIIEDGKKRRDREFVHRLVMLTFVGPPPEGHEVDHDDFDRANNALMNLKYELKAVNNNRWKKRQAEEDDRYDGVAVSDLPEPEEEVESPF